MIDTGMGKAPDPTDSSTPDEFAAALRALRFWAGQPSLRQLRRLGGTVRDGAGEIDALPESTTADLLRGDRPARAGFVRAFVAACFRARQRSPAEIASQVERWHDAWLRVSGLALPAAFDPAADPDQPPPAPRQLPPDLAWFTGRTAEVASIEDLLTAADRQVPAFVAIDGPPGVGKSALAIHAAYRSAWAYPDGQLYVDLCGATEGLAPLAPVEVLGRFLRALGVPGAEIPDQEDAAAAAFRTRTAGRRLLVVLDNATGPAQVRPLRPGASSCAVVVTSRRVLGALAGPHQLHLPVLPEPEATELLARLAGRRRVEAEPAATARVVRRCGRLPLALHLAGAKLAARPDWSVAAFAHRLAGERRLDELRVAEASVRSSFNVSYRELLDSADPVDREAARGFALIGVWDGSDLALPAVARLLDRPAAETDRLLERLVDVRLLDSPSQRRYRAHDLLRLYARELARDGSLTPDRAAALGRILRYYTATAWRSYPLIRPGNQRIDRADPRWTGGGQAFDDVGAAMCWLDAERANLLAAANQAAGVPAVAGAAVQLAQALFAYFVARGHWRDWVSVNRAALAVATRLGDPAAEAQALSDLGVAQMFRGAYPEALSYHRRSLAIYTRLGDRHGQAASLNNLGMVHCRLGRYPEAQACYRRSLASYRKLGDRSGQATSLNNLGTTYAQMGRYEQAAACHKRNITVRRQLRDTSGLAMALSNLGAILLVQGRIEEAVACLQRGMNLYQRIGGRTGRAASLRDLGTAYGRLGRESEALACLRESLRGFRELGDPYRQAECLRELEALLRRIGRVDEARRHAAQAASLERRLTAPFR